MSVPALADDLARDVAPIPLADALTSVELLIDLERSGALTPTAMQLPEIEWDVYESVGSFLGSINRRCSWYIGDWLLHGKEQFGEKFAQAASITGLAEQTLLNRMFVCENVPPSRRLEGVPFSCHAAVARLKPDEQSRWLKAAQRGGWSLAELKQRMKAARKDERPALPGTDDPVGEPDMEMLLDVARAILRDAKRDESNPAVYLVPAEDMARLTAALGQED